MDTKLFATSFTGLCISIALLLTTQTMGAQAQETQGAAHQPAPADPVAVIHVPAPREGNLLHLRGMAGRGTVYFRKNGDCSKMPVRFVAGDFAGRDRDRDHAGPIRIVVRSPGIVRGLMRGRDFVSDTALVSTDPEDQNADLHLITGLTAETGFVVNPGRGLMADVFRTRPKSVDCSMVLSQLPAQ